MFNRRTRQLFSQPLFKVWWLWMFLTGLSLLFHSKSGFEWYPWVPLAVSGIAFLLVATYADNQLNRQWLMAALLIGALATLVLASIQWNVDFPYLKHHLNEMMLSYSERDYLGDFISRGRIVGPFFSPDLFASYLLMILFVALAFLIEVRRKFLSVVCFVLVAALFFTRSLGGWLSLLISLVILSSVLSSHPNPMVKEQERLRVGINILILLLLLTGAVLLIERWQTSSEAGSLENSVIQRLNFWKSSCQMFCHSPFWGVGFTRFGEMYHYFQQAGSFETHYAHNIVLQLLAELGLLGGVWLVYWLVVLAHTSKNLLVLSSQDIMTNKILLTALVVFFIHNLVDYSFSIPQVADHWWIIAALLVVKK